MRPIIYVINRGGHIEFFVFHTNHTTPIHQIGSNFCQSRGISQILGSILCTFFNHLTGYFLTKSKEMNTAKICYFILLKTFDRKFCFIIAHFTFHVLSPLARQSSNTPWGKCISALRFKFDYSNPALPFRFREIYTLFSSPIQFLL